MIAAIVPSQHLGLVYHVVHHIYRRNDSRLEHDEMVSAGTLGLLDAARHFDASRGLAFSTFASVRIRGAIFDEIRRTQAVPRRERMRRTQIRVTEDRLAQQMGRQPTERAVAAALGIAPRRLARWKAGLDLTPMPENMPDVADPGVDLLGDLAREDTRARVRAAVVALPARERRIIEGYYFEDRTQTDLGIELGVTESRISQLRKKVHAKLHAELRVALAA